MVSAQNIFHGQTGERFIYSTVVLKTTHFYSSKNSFFMDNLNAQIEYKIYFRMIFNIFFSGLHFIEWVDVLVTLLNVCFLLRL